MAFRFEDVIVYFIKHKEYIWKKKKKKLWRPVSFLSNQEKLCEHGQDRTPLNTWNDFTLSANKNKAIKMTASQ